MVEQLLKILGAQAKVRAHDVLELPLKLEFRRLQVFAVGWSRRGRGRLVAALASALLEFVLSVSVDAVEAIPRPLLEMVRAPRVRDAVDHGSIALLDRTPARYTMNVAVVRLATTDPAFASAVGLLEGRGQHGEFLVLLLHPLQLGAERHYLGVARVNIVPLLFRHHVIVARARRRNDLVNSQFFHRADA